MLSLWLAATTAMADPAMPVFESQPMSFERDLNSFCFPSGLEFSVHTEARSSGLYWTIVVDHGLTQDGEDRAGISLVMPELWLASKPQGGPSVAKRLAAAGVTWSAQVGQDVTLLLMEAPVSALPEMLAIETERLTNPLQGIDEAKFTAVRDRVIAMRKERGELSPLEWAQWMPDGFFNDGVAVDGVPPNSAQLATLTLDDAKLAASSWVPWAHPPSNHRTDHHARSAWVDGKASWFRHDLRGGGWLQAGGRRVQPSRHRASVRGDAAGGQGGPHRGLGAHRSAHVARGLAAAPGV